MKIAIFSDIHGNLPALKLMLKDAGKVNRYICLGDVINYGPWSNECIELLQKLNNTILLLGNHEEAFIRRNYPGENKLVQSFFSICIKDFKYFDFIKTFRKQYEMNDYLYTHTINNLRIYQDSNLRLDRNYVIGHTHSQFVIKNNNHLLVNPGSVGQNRKFINVINYALYYPESDKFEFRELIYDYKVVVKEMIIKGYPNACIEYYNNKQIYSE